MNSKTTEREAKFTFDTNRQLKFSEIEKPEEMQRKLVCLLAILGFKVKDPHLENLSDDYYDDDYGTFDELGLSFRIRHPKAPGGACKITIKGPDSDLSASEMRRPEVEKAISAEDISDCLADPSKLMTFFGTSTQMPIPKTPLRRRLSLENTRLEIPFGRNRAHSSLCFDRFRYLNPELGTYSNYNYEIEVENLSEPTASYAARLNRLRSALCGIFCLKPHKQSKFARGIKFLKDPMPPSRAVTTLGLDIVDYSTRPPKEQVEIIQIFNSKLKRAIRTVGLDSESYIYIPTGDGMYVVFQNPQIAVLRLVQILQEEIRAHNKAPVQPELAFSFRACVHCGQVFTYNDVNENLNYAGNGINIAARLLSLARPWEILFSSEAHKMLCVERSSQSFFRDLDIQTVKHDEKIHVFNYWDPAGKFGQSRSI